MNPIQGQGEPFPRLPTGIHGLDEMLFGGVLVGGVYLVLGEAGAGKTIFVNQSAFHHAQTGGTVAYFTIFGETNSRLLTHISQFAFFHWEDVSTRIHYFNGYRELREGGMPALLQMVEQHIRQHNISLLILDGLPIEAYGPRGNDLFIVYDFFNHLQALCEATKCTALVSAPFATNIWEHHALLFVDGAIELLRSIQNSMVLRNLVIRKFRGGTYRGASHPFTITAEGILLLP